MTIFACLNMVFVSAALTVSAWAQTTDIQVITPYSSALKVKATDNKANSDTDKIKEIYSKLPYRGNESSLQMFSTIGQLSKLCDWVVIASLTNSVQNEEVNTGNRAFGKREITVNVETNLFGGYLDKQVTVKLSWFNVHHELKPGDRMILFLAKVNFDKYRQKQLSFDFSKTNLVGKASDTIFVLEDPPLKTNTITTGRGITLQKDQNCARTESQNPG